MLLAALLALALPPSPSLPQADPEALAAPPRREGRGPFPRLILRGAILVDGTGAPPIGPVDLVIEEERIARIVPVGPPGLPPDPARRRPEPGPDGLVLDVSGMYVLPGFVDMHGHIGGREQAVPAEYVFKLQLAHGITTIRDPGCGMGLEWTLRHRQRSAAHEITAPRIFAYAVFGQGHDGPITTPEAARAWVREIQARGVDGIKFFGAPPEVFRAALEEARRLGLRTACHHAQLHVLEANVLDTSAWGLTTMEHWYGLPEALFTGRTVQDYPAGYNYADERDRFAEAGHLWRQAAAPGSPRWEEVMSTLLERDFTLDPTFTIYEACRDLLRERCAEWHPLYTLPSLWDFYRPSRRSHGSFWDGWGTEEEVAWKDNYRRWMAFVNEFKNRGGRVTTGSDAGFIYKLYGFGYVRELELLREAGFHPLEVVRSATRNGAEALGALGDFGTVEPGKRADLVVVAGNPLANFQLLYGTGVLALDDADRPVRRGGVRWTIHDGIVYDAPALLADVRRMVQEAWRAAGRRLTQPGLEEPVPAPGD